MPSPVRVCGEIHDPANDGKPDRGPGSDLRADGPGNYVSKTQFRITSDIRFICGNALDALREMPDESVHCVITSPPFYGLRNYGTGQWIGGDPDCAHAFRAGRGAGDCDNKGGPPRAVSPMRGGDATRCVKCGAAYEDQQIGMEATLADHIGALVEIFREVRRVLRRDGVCWIEYGDAYATQVNGRSAHDTKLKGNDDRSFRDKPFDTVKASGLRGKCQMLLPARLAIALIDDGWIIRKDIIYHRTNPMPESASDRPTSSHSHIFMLTREPRYWSDFQAIRTPAKAATRKAPDGWDTGPGAHGNVHRKGRQKGAKVEPASVAAGANIRDVWSLSTEPFKEAHFAVLSSEVVRRCILAGCPGRACAECGAPWKRVKVKTFVPQPDVSDAKHTRRETEHDSLSRRAGSERGSVHVETKGWAPTCGCHVNYCPTCGGKGETKSEDKVKKTTHQMPLVQESDEELQVLLHPMHGQMGCKTSEKHEGMDDHQQGISACSIKEPSEREQRRICLGAPARDGEDTRTIPAEGRSGPSSEREEIGQSAGKSRGNGKTSARRKPKTGISREMSVLQEDISDARECLHCGSELERRPAPTRPGVCLDPFSGAGTTAIVAYRTGRDAIGIELNADYVAMAEQRLERERTKGAPITMEEWMDADPAPDASPAAPAPDGFYKPREKKGPGKKVAMKAGPGRQVVEPPTIDLEELIAESLKTAA